MTGRGVTVGRNGIIAVYSGLSWLRSKGFKPTNKDPCYYTLKAGGEEIHLICYVDDLAFAGSNATVLAAFREALQRDFQMQDMGMLNWFLGCEIIQDLAAGTTKLVQTKYINDMLARFDFMSDIQGVDSPSPHNSKPLSKAKCPADPAQADKDLWWRPFYRPLIGSLLYAAVLSCLGLSPWWPGGSRLNRVKNMNMWNLRKNREQLFICLTQAKSLKMPFLNERIDNVCDYKSFEKSKF